MKWSVEVEWVLMCPHSSVCDIWLVAVWIIRWAAAGFSFGKVPMKEREREKGKGGLLATDLERSENVES